MGLDEDEEDELAEVARRMRSYAFEHPLDHSVMLARDPRSMIPYTQDMLMQGHAIRMIFTYTVFEKTSMAQLSCSNTMEWRELPTPITAVLCKAFFDRRDKPTLLPRSDREEMYAEVGWTPGLSGRTTQYLAWNPRKDGR